MANIQQTILKKLSELNDKEILAFISKYGKGNIKGGSEVFIIEGGTGENGEKINVTVKIVGDDMGIRSEEETIIAKEEEPYEEIAPLEVEDSIEDIQPPVESMGEGFTESSKVSSFSEFLKS